MADNQHTPTKNEEWRPVIGYEGRYEVSDQGRVRRLPREFTDSIGRIYRFEEKVLRPGRNTDSGHVTVFLADKSKKQSSKQVHVLVLEAFVGPRPEGTEACHFNDIASDNRLENLRWASRRDNNLDRVRNGIHPMASKTHCKRGHEFTPENTRLEVRPNTTARRCRACERERCARRDRTEKKK